MHSLTGCRGVQQVGGAFQRKRPPAEASACAPLGPADERHHCVCEDAVRGAEFSGCVQSQRRCGEEVRQTVSCILYSDALLLCWWRALCDVGLATCVLPKMLHVFCCVGPVTNRGANATLPCRHTACLTGIKLTWAPNAALPLQQQHASWLHALLPICVRLKRNS